MEAHTALAQVPSGERNTATIGMARVAGAGVGNCRIQFSLQEDIHAILFNSNDTFYI